MKTRMWVGSLGLGWVLFGAVGCGRDFTPTGPRTQRAATVYFEVHGPAFVRIVAVQVSGPGMDSSLVFNVNIDAAGAGSGTLRIPAGGGRQIAARAFDANGIETHRGDTTVALVEGANPSLALTLRPLTGSVPVVLTFGGSGITVSPGDTAIAVGDTVRFAAAGVDSLGDAIVPGSVSWSSTNPAIVGVSATGLARGRATGTAYVLATFGGASVGRTVTVH